MVGSGNARCLSRLTTPIGWLWPPYVGLRLSSNRTIIGVISYFTDTLICPIIPSSPWKFEYSRRYIIPQTSLLAHVPPFVGNERNIGFNNWELLLHMVATTIFDSIGNLTSPGCKSVNVLNLFDRTSRRHRSHGSRRYNRPEIHNVSFDSLLPFVNLQLGLHHILTRLYSLPLKTLHVLYESTLTLHFNDVGSPEHRLQGIIFGHFLKQAFQSCQGL